MSDNFIPLNQSTPVHNPERWQGRNQNRSGYQNNWQQSHQRHHSHRRGNNSHRNSSFGNDSNNSMDKDSSNIDAYLHPSMLQDPWAKLRQKE